jgi:hypothetical protein
MIAIHDSNENFQKYWVQYCISNEIPYKLVNCFANDLISQIKGCSALMWHHFQSDPKALIVAKPILFALEQSGIRVFPDFKTSWHFDDKLGQKYLFESLDIPMVNTYVFLEKKEALNWALNTKYPKVFKLRGGAGSANVKLIDNYLQAKRVINIAFGKGFNNYNGLGHFKELVRKWRLGKTTFVNVIKGFGRIFVVPQFAKVAGKERGYVYFQDFISDNSYDIRVIVIGDNAFAIKRMVRKNDFRASGSADIHYKKELFKDEWIKHAFEINDRIKSQSLAIDYVFENGVPLVVEISYGFMPSGYFSCVGYWDKDLNWYEGDFNPYGWMVENIIKDIK